MTVAPACPCTPRPVPRPGKIPTMSPTTPRGPPPAPRAGPPPDRTGRQSGGPRLDQRHDRLDRAAHAERTVEAATQRDRVEVRSDEHDRRFGTRARETEQEIRGGVTA